MNTLQIVCLTVGLLAGDMGTAIGQEKQPHMWRWTDITGKHSVMAELVDFTDGQVRLKKQNGEVVSLPLEKLSLAHRRFVQQATARRQPAPSMAAPAPAGQADAAGKAKTGRCAFEITGLMHRWVPTSFPIGDREIQVDVYTVCSECWGQVRREEGFRPLSRQISTTQSTASPQAQHSPLTITTEHTFPLDEDLAPIARAVARAKTPHKSSRAFFVLLRAKVNARSEKAALAALRRIRGVDPRGTSIDAETGVIRVQVSGRARLRLTDIISALSRARIEAKPLTDRAATRPKLPIGLPGEPPPRLPR